MIMKLLRWFFSIFQYTLYVVPGFVIGAFTRKFSNRIDQTNDLNEITKNLNKINLWTIAHGAVLWGLFISYFIYINESKEATFFITLFGITFILFVLRFLKK